MHDLVGIDIKIVGKTCFDFYSYICRFSSLSAHMDVFGEKQS